MYIKGLHTFGARVMHARSHMTLNMNTEMEREACWQKEHGRRREME